MLSSSRSTRDRRLKLDCSPGRTDGVQVSRVPEINPLWLPAALVAQVRSSNDRYPGGRADSGGDSLGRDWGICGRWRRPRNSYRVLIVSSPFPYRQTGPLLPLGIDLSFLRHGWQGTGRGALWRLRGVATAPRKLPQRHVMNGIVEHRFWTSDVFVVHFRVGFCRTTQAACSFILLRAKNAGFRRPRRGAT